ncbi:MAG: hypothetical protein O2973_12755 [Gemmatimonadetes bacterium]|nr:hypothetical protein [Gemmatimonadota bacterium]
MRFGRDSCLAVGVCAAIALVAVALAPPAANAQCRAGVRELSNPSAREQLTPRPVVADAATCGPGAAGTRRFLQLFGLQEPTLRLNYRGGVRDARYDGGASTGVGFNAFARAAFSFDRGIVHALFAPELSVSQNKRFNFFPAGDTSRSDFASSWYLATYSMDLPTRFGADAIKELTLGQSALWVNARRADVGVSASAQAWGPGLRGNLVLGPDAPGIPRLFVRSAAPIVTRAGAWSATAFIGTLTESPFFDHDRANDLRTLTAWTVNWSPDSSSGFSVGVAHAAMRVGSLLGGDRKATGPTDRMNSVFGSFRAPGDGTRAWVEIARAGTLPSLRQFLTVPYQGLAYLVGVERAIVKSSGTLLISAEAANLEQPTDIRGELPQDFYTSGAIPHGWTQRGRLLGYGAGPGGQSQWIAVDWITPTRSTGVFIERVRWNEDVFLRQFLPYLNRHDVTLHAGVRGDTQWRGRSVRMQLSAGRRLNYLFQNGEFIAGYNTVDIGMTELSISISPAK